MSISYDGEPRVDDPESVWRILETQTPPVAGSVAVAPLPRRVEAGAVQVGVDHDRNRHLLVPMLNDEDVEPVTASAGIHLVQIKSNGLRYLSLMCLDRYLFDAFSKLAVEVLSVLSSTGPTSPSVRRLFLDWEELFARSAGGMSSVEQLGLYGELLVLEQLLAHRAVDAVSAWTGPDRSQHDFRFARRAIEVKASAAREGRSARISSLQQLEPPVGGSLVLVYVRLEIAPNGRSLKHLAHAVGASCEWHTEYRSRLRAAGYSFALESTYNTPMLVVEQRWYDVSEPHFPRITGASFKAGVLPPGTRELEYTIDLSNEPPMPLSMSEIDGLWSELRRK
ncbi:PD-(D/E)XK motif protein [Agromyces sp. NPDC058064]|uniref:PD-(D/E)XK motif protein n=1 Tax=Agromyces sp. NPDC058064 TaxID=3346322 RepID=UPI0036DBAF95